MAARTRRFRGEIPRHAGSWSRDLLFVPVAAFPLALGTGCFGVVCPETVYDYADEGCGVPPGHLPPPGECRLWYPDLPPGQQPPPGDCYELEHHVPADACLLYGE